MSGRKRQMSPGELGRPEAPLPFSRFGYLAAKPNSHRGGLVVRSVWREQPGNVLEPDFKRAWLQFSGSRVLRQVAGTALQQRHLHRLAPSALSEWPTMWESSSSLK